MLIAARALIAILLLLLTRRPACVRAFEQRHSSPKQTSDDLAASSDTAVASSTERFRNRDDLKPLLPVAGKSENNHKPTTNSPGSETELWKRNSDYVIHKTVDLPVDDVHYDADTNSEIADFLSEANAQTLASMSSPEKQLAPPARTSSRSTLSLTLAASSGPAYYYEDQGRMNLLAGTPEIVATAGIDFITVVQLNVLDSGDEVLSLETFQLSHTADVGGRNITFQYDVTPVYTFDSTSVVLNLTGLLSIEEYQLALATLGYENTKQEPTARFRGLQITVFDTEGSSASQNVFFIVLSANDSPFFTATPDSISIAEDGSYDSTTTSLFQDGLIADNDADSTYGIAVLGADNSNGQWEYTDASGVLQPLQDGDRDSAGNVLRSTSVTQLCVVLRDVNIRYTPNADFHGTTSLAFVAWDQTGSSASLQQGDTANVTWTTAGDAYSVDLAVVTIVVVPVNDAPRVASSNLDLGVINSTADFATSALLQACADDDLQHDATLTNIGVAVSAVDATNGAWDFTTDGGGTWTGVSDTALLLGADGDDSGAKIRFAPSSGFAGSVEVKFRCWDFTDGRSSGSTGVNASYTGATGAYSEEEVTATLTVSIPNTRPAFQAGTTHIQLPVGDTPTLATTVQDLVSAVYVDDDGPGLAVIGVEDTTSGQFQYTCEGSDPAVSNVTWLPFVSASGAGYAAYASPSDTYATLLSSTCYLRYQLNGSSLQLPSSAAMHVRAWDGSDGLATGSYDVDVTSASGISFGLENVTVGLSYVDGSLRPAITGTQEQLTFTEGDADTTLLPDAQLTQLTSSSSQRVVQLSVFISAPLDANETLQFGASHGYASEQDIPSSVNLTWSSDHTAMTLTGDDDVTVYQTALRSVVYRHLSDAPTAGNRRIEALFTDAAGMTSPVFARNLTVTSVNDAPTLSVVTSSASEVWDVVEYRRGSGEGQLFGDNVTMMASDPDQSAPSRVDVTITIAYDGSLERVSIPASIQTTTQFNDSVSVLRTLEVNSSYAQATSTLSFSLTGDHTTADDYVQALRHVTYSTAAEPPDFRHRDMTLSVWDELGAESNRIGFVVQVVEANGTVVVDLPAGTLPNTPVIARIVAVPRTVAGTELHSDSKLSSGDQLQIQFDRATNMPPFGWYDAADPVQAANKQLTRTQVDQLFTFDQQLTTSAAADSYSGAWTADTIFTLTLTREAYPQSTIQIGTWTASPVIGAACLAPAQSAGADEYCIRDATGRSNSTLGSSPALEGSWGLRVPDVNSVTSRRAVTQSGVVYVTSGSIQLVAVVPALSKTQLDGVCLLGFQALFGSMFTVEFSGLTATLLTCTNKYVQAYDFGVDSTDQVPTVTDLEIELTAQSSASVQYPATSVANHLNANFNRTAVIEVISSDQGISSDTLEQYASTVPRSAVSTLQENDVTTTPSISSVTMQRSTGTHASDGDVGIRTGDRIVIAFDRATDQPQVSAKSDLDLIFTFDAELSTGSYSGSWTGNTLVITLDAVTTSAQTLTIAFAPNYLDNATQVPVGYANQVHCVGLDVCGANHLSVGVCDVTGTSCRAQGSFTATHVASGSVTSAVADTGGTVEWWWLLLIGLFLLISIVAVAWLTRHFLRNRKENEKDEDTDIESHVYDEADNISWTSIPRPSSSTNSWVNGQTRNGGHHISNRDVTQNGHINKDASHAMNGDVNQGGRHSKSFPPPCKPTTPRRSAKVTPSASPSTTPDPVTSNLQPPISPDQRHVRFAPGTDRASQSSTPMSISAIRLLSSTSSYRSIATPPTADDVTTRDDIMTRGDVTAQSRALCIHQLPVDQICDNCDTDSIASLPRTARSLPAATAEGGNDFTVLRRSQSASRHWQRAMSVVKGHATSGDELISSLVGPERTSTSSSSASEPIHRNTSSSSGQQNRSRHRSSLSGLPITWYVEPEVTTPTPQLSEREQQRNLRRSSSSARRGLDLGPMTWLTDK